jgi:MFS family permease
MAGVTATDQIPSSRWQAFSAMRHSNYRIFWFSLLAFVSAQQVIQLVLLWAVYDLTDSAYYVGALGLANSLPAILVTMVGGVIADRMDRRLVLMFAMSLQTIVAAGVVVIGIAGVVAAWHLVVAAALIGSLMGLEGPSRQAILPNLVDRKDLMNAVALFSSVWQGTRIIFPVIGGFLYAVVGLTGSFAVVTAAFALSVVLIVFVRTTPTIASSEPFVRQMVSGLAFIKNNNLFSSMIGLTFFNSFFGMSYIYLLPIFTKDFLGIGSVGLGVLFGGSAVGALFGTLGIAAFGRDRHRNFFLLGGAVLFGSTLIVFANLHHLSLAIPGLSVTATTFAMAIGVLAVSGAANSAYMITIQTVLQAAVPDELRGRVMGVHGLTWSLMPLGGWQSSWVAGFFGAPIALTVGGVAIIVYAAGVVARPGFRRRVVEATPDHT